MVTTAFVAPSYFNGKNFPDNTSPAPIAKAALANRKNMFPSITTILIVALRRDIVVCKRCKEQRCSTFSIRTVRAFFAWCDKFSKVLHIFQKSSRSHSISATTTTVLYACLATTVFMVTRGDRNSIKLLTTDTTSDNFSRQTMMMIAHWLFCCWNLIYLKECA